MSLSNFKILFLKKARKKNDFQDSQLTPEPKILSFKISCNPSVGKISKLQFIYLFPKRKWIPI